MMMKNGDHYSYPCYPLLLSETCQHSLATCLDSSVGQIEARCTEKSSVVGKSLMMVMTTTMEDEETDWWNCKDYTFAHHFHRSFVLHDDHDEDVGA